MRISSFLVFILMAGSAILAERASAQGCSWAIDEGGAGSEQGRAIVTDASGNSYSTGLFTGTVSFPCATLSSAGNTDIYVAKYDDSGTCQWVVSAGGSAADAGLGIALSPSGEVFVTGQFRGTASFPTGSIVSAGGSDIFLAKYDSAGNGLWVKRVGGGPSTTQDDIGEDLVVDASGAVYLTGRFAGASTFECGTVASVSNWNAFFAKYDSTGSCLWNTTTTSSGSGSTYGRGIVVSGSVVSVVGDYVFGRAQFPGLAATALGNAGISGGEASYLAKLDASNGTVTSAINIANNIQIVPIDIAVDSTGNTYTAGRIGVTTLDFGCGILTSSGGTDVFVVKHSPASACLWVERGSGTSGDDSALDVSHDGVDQLYLSGFFEDEITFDTTTLSTNSGRDGWLGKFDAATGAIAWLTKTTAGSGSSSANGVSSDADNAWATGEFAGIASTHCATLSSKGASESFIAKFGDLPVPVELESFTIE